MLVASTEGRGTQFELLDIADGYLVLTRSLDASPRARGRDLVFRTAPVAFAYLDLATTRDRLNGAQGEEAEALSADLDRQRELYEDLCQRLTDSGMAFAAVLRHDAHRDASERLRFH